MKIRIISSLLIALILLVSCAVTKNKFGLTIIDNTADNTSTKQEIFKIKSIDNNIFDTATFIGTEQIEIKYRLFAPKQKSKKKYPLVIVYHGSGAIGTDNKSQLGLLPKLFASPGIQAKYPAYVLAPQFSTRSSDYATDTAIKLLYSTSRPCVTSVLELIDSLKSNLNVDNRRIYVIGYSMGGSTVINSLATKPELFAAGISIAGIPQFDKTQLLNNIPIWLIHGTDDTENPISSDEMFYKEMSNRILFWKLKETTHDNIFSSLILGETLPKWLFEHIKKTN
jgi:predicted peptidase